MAERKMRDYEVSIWSLQDDFIAVLKTAYVENKGQISEPKITLKTDGTQNIRFSIPMYLYQDGVRVANPAWYNTRNGNLIINMRKIKVIFNKYTEDERIFDFMITKVTERHEDDELYCDVEAEGLAFNELGKTGYKISLSSQQFYDEDYELTKKQASANNSEIVDGEASEPEQLHATIDYWLKKMNLQPVPTDNKLINANTWYYVIKMDWSSYADGNDTEKRAEDKIYEEPYVSSWQSNDENSTVLVPKAVETYKEKERLLDVEESNIYNLTQTLAETFGVFCRYEYLYDDNYHIIGRRIIFYNNYMQEKLGYLSLTYPTSTNSISREIDSNDTITKLYVKPVTNVNSDSGWSTITNVGANKSMEDYILNFEYMHDTGAITADQYAEIKKYEEAMHNYNTQMLPLEQKIEGLNARLPEVEGQKALAKTAKQLDQERLTAANGLLDQLDIEDGNNDGRISINPATPVTVIGLEDSSKNDGSYYITLSDKGIYLDTLKIYRDFDIVKRELKDQIQTGIPEYDEFGNLYRIRNLYYNSMVGENESHLLYLTYDYTPKTYYDNVVKTWEDRLAKDTADEQRLGIEVDRIKEELEECNTQLQTLLDNKQKAVTDFETMMGPALREGYWQPDNYKDYGDKYIDTSEGFFTTEEATTTAEEHQDIFEAAQLYDKNFSGHYAKLLWDETLFDDEVKNYYEFGVNLEKKYYPCIELTPSIIEILNQSIETTSDTKKIDQLSFLFYNSKAVTTGQRDVKNRQAFSLGSQMQLGFIKKITGTSGELATETFSATPVLILTGADTLDEKTSLLLQQIKSEISDKPVETETTMVFSKLPTSVSTSLYSTGEDPDSTFLSIVTLADYGQLTQISGSYNEETDTAKYTFKRTTRTYEGGNKIVLPSSWGANDDIIIKGFSDDIFEPNQPHFQGYTYREGKQDQTVKTTVEYTDTNATCIYYLYCYDDNNVLLSTKQLSITGEQISIKNYISDIELSTIAYVKLAFVTEKVLKKTPTFTVKTTFKTFTKKFSADPVLGRLVTRNQANNIKMVEEENYLYDETKPAEEQITVQWAEDKPIIYPRIEIDSLFLKTSDQELVIQYNGETLKNYEDYYITSRENKYYITFKPDFIIRHADKDGNILNGQLLIKYTLSNADTSIYLDALQVAKENSRPKISYQVRPSMVNEDFIYNDYDKLARIVNINDIDLNFENVQGYISDIDLDLDEPWNDSVTVQNYKSKFEDLFSTIVAQTEAMKKSEYTISLAGSLFMSNGQLSGQVVQDSLKKVDLNYAFNNGKLTIDDRNGIIGLSDAGVVAMRGGGIFTATEKDSDGNWIWNTGIVPQGINADLITTGQLDTNRIKIYAGDRAQFQLNGKGLYAYKLFAQDTDLSAGMSAAVRSNLTFDGLDPTQYVVFNSEGLFLTADRGAVVLNENRSDFVTVMNKVNRVEISWDGLVLRNYDGAKTLYADPDTGNLFLAGTVYADSFHIIPKIYDTGEYGEPLTLTDYVTKGLRMELDDHIQTNEKLLDMFAQAGKAINDALAGREDQYEEGTAGDRIYNQIQQLDFYTPQTHEIISGKPKPTKDVIVGDILIVKDNTTGNEIERYIATTTPDSNHTNVWTRVYDGRIQSIDGAKIDIDGYNGAINILAQSHIDLSGGDINITGNKSVNIGSKWVNIAGNNGGINIVNDTITNATSANGTQLANSRIALDQHGITMHSSRIEMIAAASGNGAGMILNPETGIDFASTSKIMFHAEEVMKMPDKYTYTGSDGKEYKNKPTTDEKGDLTDAGLAWQRDYYDRSKASLLLQHDNIRFGILDGNNTGSIVDITKEHLLMSSASDYTLIQSSNKDNKVESADGSAVEITKKSIYLASKDGTNAGVVSIKPDGVLIGQVGGSGRTGEGGFINITRNRLEIASGGNLYIDANNIKLDSTRGSGKGEEPSDEVLERLSELEAKELDPEQELTVDEQNELKTLLNQADVGFRLGTEQEPKLKFAHGNLYIQGAIHATSLFVGAKYNEDQDYGSMADAVNGVIGEDVTDKVQDFIKTYDIQRGQLIFTDKKNPATIKESPTSENYKYKLYTGDLWYETKTDGQIVIHQWKTTEGANEGSNDGGWIMVMSPLRTFRTEKKNLKPAPNSGILSIDQIVTDYHTGDLWYKENDQGIIELRRANKDMIPDKGYQGDDWDLIDTRSGSTIFTNTSNNVPQNPRDGDIWYCMDSNGTVVVKQYDSTSSSKWKEVKTEAQIFTDTPHNYKAGDIWYDSSQGQNQVVIKVATTTATNANYNPDHWKEANISNAPKTFVTHDAQHIAPKDWPTNYKIHDMWYNITDTGITIYEAKGITYTSRNNNNPPAWKTFIDIDWTTNTLAFPAGASTYMKDSEPSEAQIGDIWYQTNGDNNQINLYRKTNTREEWTNNLQRIDKGIRSGSSTSATSKDGIYYRNNTGDSRGNGWYRKLNDGDTNVFENWDGPLDNIIELTQYEDGYTDSQTNNKYYVIKGVRKLYQANQNGDPVWTQIDLPSGADGVHTYRCTATEASAESDTPVPKGVTNAHEGDMWYRIATGDGSDTEYIVDIYRYNETTQKWVSVAPKKITGAKLTVDAQRGEIKLAASNTIEITAGQELKISTVRDNSNPNPNGILTLDSTRIDIVSSDFNIYKLVPVESNTSTGSEGQNGSGSGQTTPLVMQRASTPSLTINNTGINMQDDTSFVVNSGVVQITGNTTDKNSNRIAFGYKTASYTEEGETITVPVYDVEITNEGITSDTGNFKYLTANTKRVLTTNDLNYPIFISPKPELRSDSFIWVSPQQNVPGGTDTVLVNMWSSAKQYSSTYTDSEYVTPRTDIVDGETNHNPDLPNGTLIHWRNNGLSELIKTPELFEKARWLDIGTYTFTDVGGVNSNFIGAPDTYHYQFTINLMGVFSDSYIGGSVINAMSDGIAIAKVMLVNPSNNNTVVLKDSGPRWFKINTTTQILAEGDSPVSLLDNDGNLTVQIYMNLSLWTDPDGDNSLYCRIMDGTDSKKHYYSLGKIGYVIKKFPAGYTAIGAPEVITYLDGATKKGDMQISIRPKYKQYLTQKEVGGKKVIPCQVYYITNEL